MFTHKLESARGM